MWWPDGRSRGCHTFRPTYLAGAARAGRTSLRPARPARASTATSPKTSRGGLAPSARRPKRLGTHRAGPKATAGGLAPSARRPKRLGTHRAGPKATAGSLAPSARRPKWLGTHRASPKATAGSLVPSARHPKRLDTHRASPKATAGSLAPSARRPKWLGTHRASPKATAGSLVPSARHPKRLDTHRASPKATAGSLAPSARRPKRLDTHHDTLKVSTGTEPDGLLPKNSPLGCTLACMDPANFTSTTWGQVRRTLGRHGYNAYFPARIHREINLDRNTVALQSKADLALGRLAGAGRILPNAELLVTPYMLEEALYSSRIEGTQATLSDVFSANASGESDGVDIREVLNYRSAMRHGLDRLGGELPLSLRLMREMHEILLTDVRGQEKTPGEFRKSQNWIGSPDNSIDRARFVPPPVDAMVEALSDWERYQHEEDMTPLLVRCGVLHYQFETIHPFLDGNGRLGRLFITLYLVEKGPLSKPLLYLSSFFETAKNEYYDRLQAVRESGDLAGWLSYFFTAVATQAEDAVAKAEKLIDLRERYRTTVFTNTRSRAVEAVDLLLANPVLTASFVAEQLKTTSQTGLNILRQLEGLKIVREIEPTRAGRYRWEATEVLETVYGQTPVGAL